MTFNVGEDLPDSSAWEKETIVSPFVKVKSIEKIGRRRTERGTYYDAYDLVLESAELIQMPKQEREALLNSIMADAPEMYELLALITGNSEQQDYIQFKIDMQKKSLLRCEKEISELSNERIKMIFLKSEKDIINLVDLWSMALSQTGGISGDGSKDLSSLYSKLRELGFTDTEYTEEFEEKIATMLKQRIKDFSEWLEDAEPSLKGLCEKYFAIEEKSGFSKNGMLDELYQAIEKFSTKTSSGNLHSFTQVLYSSGEFMCDHLKKCGVDYDTDFEDRINTLDVKINRVYEDIDFLNEDISNKEEEKRLMDDKVRKAIPRVATWKANIAKLCMSDCKDIELALQAEIEKVEIQIEIENIEKSKESARQDVEEGQVGEQSEEMYDQPKSEQVAQKAKQVSEKTTHLIEALNPQNVVFVDNPRLDYNELLIRSRRIANEIQNLSRVPYQSDVERYGITVGTLASTINKGGEIATTTQNEDRFMALLNGADDIEAMIREGIAGREIIAFHKKDENLLKKLIFERFCDVAISAEVASLKKEADTIRTAENKKGIFRLFNGVSKKDIERRKSIDIIVEYATAPDNKPFMGLDYSYREIMADMDFFMEEHSGDEAYARAIADVQRLQYTLSSYFSVPNNSGIENRKKKRIADRDASGIDPRVYRINSLKQRLERRGICTKACSCQSLYSARVLDDTMKKEIHTFGLYRNIDNRKHNEFSE